ncbi:hypothetical protein CI610_03707 [invertebrate metagenome]|uniref:Uncharacterized protein n=1 Tax=invertebrate metagenome TaxID=1711999 RepID=A0A2H9T2C3_9ZZZZ
MLTQVFEDCKNASKRCLYSKTHLCRTRLNRIHRMSRTFRSVPIFSLLYLSKLSTDDSNTVESNTAVVSNIFCGPSLLNYTKISIFVSNIEASCCLR